MFPVTLPKCAVLTCENTADPRFYAHDVHGRAVMICDGHEPVPPPSEVAIGAPDPSAHELAERVVRDGYAATPDQVTLIASALIVEADELAELRDLADLVRDADISALPPELLAVRQRWIAESCAEEAALTDRAPSPA